MSDNPTPIREPDARSLATILMVKSYQPFLTKDRKAEKDAYASLALTMRRQAHQYRRWALEAEQGGKLEEYRRWRDEANEYWSRAKAYLRTAMHHADQAA